MPDNFKIFRIKQIPLFSYAGTTFKKNVDIDNVLISLRKDADKFLKSIGVQDLVDIKTHRYDIVVFTVKSQESLDFVKIISHENPTFNDFTENTIQFFLRSDYEL